MVSVTLARLTAVGDTVISAEWAHAQGELHSLNAEVGSKALALPKLQFLLKEKPPYLVLCFPYQAGWWPAPIQTPTLQHYSADKMRLFPSSPEPNELLPRLVQPALTLQGHWTPVHMRFGAAGVRNKTFPHCSGCGSSRDLSVPWLLRELHPSGRKWPSSCIMGGLDQILGKISLLKEL